MVQWLRLHLVMQGVQVWSLVGELRSHISHSQKKKKSQSRGSKKLNKDFKNGPHQIKIFKRRKKKRLSWQTLQSYILSFFLKNNLFMILLSSIDPNLPNMSMLTTTNSTSFFTQTWTLFVQGTLMNLKERGHCRTWKLSPTPINGTNWTIKPNTTRE